MLDKIKNKIKNLPLPIIIGGVFFIITLITVVSIMLPQGDSKIKVGGIQKPSPPKEKTEENKTILPPSVPDILEEEKNIQQKQKKYLGSVNTAPAQPGSQVQTKKQQDEEVFEEKIKKIIEKQEKEQYKLRPQTLPSAPPSAEDVQRQEKEKKESTKKKEIFAYFISYTPTTGKPLASPEKSNQTPVDESKKRTESNDSIKDFIIYNKFYTAKSVNTITSTQQVDKARFVAKITESSPLKGANLYGKISSINFVDNRINIVFNSMELDGKQYKINARAFSVDKNEGIVSNIKYNDPAKIETAGALAFGSAMLNALRRDSSTTTNALWGSQITEQKADDRLREGLLAGGSSAFNEMKNIVNNSMRSLPSKEIIFEKDNPLLILFELPEEQ